MSFSLLILGCGSATPAKGRHLTSQLLNVNENYYLIDCGEGTQMQLRKFGINFQRISHVFISHLHGDHYFGLIGMISTFHLLGRTKELKVFGPDGLDEIIYIQLRASNTYLKYSLTFYALKKTEEEIWTDENVRVDSLIMKHGILCWGFRFTETEKKRKILEEKLKGFDVPHYAYNLLKNCRNVEDNNGKLMKWEEVTVAPEKPKSYAFCSDTKFQQKLSNKLSNVDLMYHEATFGDDMMDLAGTYYHSTARQAATLAKASQAKRLLLGHFSNRYDDLSVLEIQAREVFPETHLAEEGKIYEI